MQSIQALRERIAALAKQVRALVEKNNESWTSEHQASYDADMAQIEDLKNQVLRIEAMRDADREAADAAALAEAGAKGASASNGKKADRGMELYTKFLRMGDKGLSAEDWREIRATLSTTTGSEGGYTVQTDVAARVVDALKAFGGMRAAAQVIRTAMGNDMSFPTSDGTSEVGELIAQNTTATAADPTFGTVSVVTYKFSSKIVAVPFELLQDSEIDVASFIEQRLTQRIGRITNQFFTTGTGSSQPRGVVVGATAGKTGTTGQTTSVIFDDLIDLVHSVDPAYRAGTCRFMMADSSLKVVRKLKDSQNRPVFLPGYDGLGGAMGDSLLGYPVVINQDVATMAANAKSILFGDFSAYIVRDVMAPTLFRFEDSAYAKLGQVGFLMWHRAGGNLLDTAAVKYYANSAT
jgi:HK97 family phage major capsid protein